jgi:hypothetical protein
VFIERIEELPADAEKVDPENGRFILAEGEATGHAHAVPAVAASLYMAQTMMYLQVLEETEVLHEEHGSIPLGEGLYKVTRQKEYFPTENRRVAD